jgi:thiol-disulfide isomerase/thioredoxin
MKPSLYIYTLVAALFIGVGAYVGAVQTAPDPAQPTAVSQLMGESLPDAKGLPQAMKQWQGKALVINFWATWCAPCVKEMPELSALQILGIGIDSPKNIGEFSTKYQISYPLFATGMAGSKYTRAFGNQAGGLPFTVLVDARGQIRKTYLGALKMDELRRDITKL